MSNTTVPDAAVVAQWEDDYFKDYINASWFRKFSGDGKNSMIQMKEQLTTKPGGSITMHLVHKLAAGGAKNQDETLEGAERELDLRTQEITIREYAEAIKWKVYDEQLTAIDLRQANRDVLMDWNMELERDLIIEAMGSINGTPYADASEAQKDAWLVDNRDRALFGALRGNSSSLDHSVALATIDSAADKLGTSALSLMKRMAKTASPKIRPYKVRDAIDKSDAYIVFAGTLTIRDLANETEFKRHNEQARDRGLKNPLFTGADYVWDNLFIYEVEDLPVLTGVGNGGIDVSPVYLCGAQALGHLWAKRPTTVDQMFDYKRKAGIGIKQWSKVEKLRFGTGPEDKDDPKDCGILTGFFAATGDA